MTTTHLLTRRATPDDRLPLARMLELYNHDLSEFWPHDLDMHGEYGYELDRYWARDRHVPYIVLVKGRFAGFALVNDETRVQPSGWWMDQFFVLRKYRRAGVGGAVARHVFSELTGAWEVGQILINHPAQAFWRKTIGQFANGAFSERTLTGGGWEGVVQCFTSPADG